MNIFRIAIVCILPLLLASCARRPGLSEPVLAPPATETVGGKIFQAGIASWYGDDFQGKPTADGEIYDMRKLTAAHRELPFHTFVEVENLDNGRRVMVRINDRGPFRDDRVIDLSFAAAERLGMTEQGTAEVNLRVVRWHDARTDQAPPPPLVRGCIVQAGAFAVRENAEDLLLTMSDIFPDLVFRVIEEEGLYKVVSPVLSSSDECRQVLQELAAHNLQGFAREARAILDE